MRFDGVLLIVMELTVNSCGTWSNLMEVVDQSLTITCKTGPRALKAVTSGEALDGEGAMGSAEYPVFPSGDGVAGGDAVITM